MVAMGEIAMMLLEVEATKKYFYKKDVLKWDRFLFFATESVAQCNVSTLVNGGANEGANLIETCSVCSDREADPYGCSIFKINISGFDDDALACGVFDVTLLPSTGQGYDIWDGDLRTYGSCVPPKKEDVPNNQPTTFSFKSVTGNFLFFSVCAQGSGNVSFDRDAFKIVPGIRGCMDPNSCTYNPDAVCEDPNAPCQYKDECGVCGGDGIPAGDCV